MADILPFSVTLDLDPAPPPGRQVYFMDEEGRPCKASKAFMFTWAGAERWHKMKVLGARPETPMPDGK